MLERIEEFLNDETIYAPDQIEEVIKKVRHNFRFSQLNTKHKYFNVPAAFDIETSSFYDDAGQKTGIMYAWMFGIYGLVILGRTWEEFETMLKTISDILDLNENKRLIVYVHNLQFDFQFFRKHCEFIKVFAIDKRRPLYALTESGIEFRCSYLLSGFNLDTLGKNLIMFPRRKKTGDLNYDLIRHHKTPLTSTEKGYCIADVKVVMSYIAEEILRMQGIARLPYTKTGYVRQYCRNQCFYEKGKAHKKSKKRLRFRDTMRCMILTPELYTKLKEGFSGGFTHANALYSGQTMQNVASFDITSSYPTVMISERYPMGAPEKLDTVTMSEDEFYHNINNYCCLFTIHFYNIAAKPDVFENYISESHCMKVNDPVVNNGRVVSASYLCTTITEVDFEIIKAFYDYECFEVSYFTRWARGWLPKDLVLSILQLYKDKTTLKGVTGKESEYMVSKGMLNSIYGMSVMNPVRKINNYDSEWLEPVMPCVEDEIEKYNKKWSRFLYYPWGIYVTAYARRNLFLAIQECGIDYIYSDTDSVKFINYEKHITFFNEYNNTIIQRLKYALKSQNIEPDAIEPVDVKGNKKPLGVWDFEGIYSRFKTLGAKRYMIEDQEGNLSMTVSGINKKVCVPYLLDTYKNNDLIFDRFRNGLHIPPEYTGKKTHTYIDDLRTGAIKDYQGNYAEYAELSGIHLESASYDLSITSGYINYLKTYIEGGKYSET